MPEPNSGGLELAIRQQSPVPIDAELVCRPGELVALIGPSGSGKTTLLRLIAGLGRPQTGVISCDGHVWFEQAKGINLATQYRRVGLVFQDYALFPHRNALENIALALGHLPKSQRNQRARDLLATVHLAGLEQRRPGELSGGQRQRVAVARALAREPSVLLLDEPFSAVDQMTRRRLQRELASLRTEIKIPIILVTHDLNEANALADRLYVLHHGSTLQQGAPTLVYRRPCNAVVARLMGHSNIFFGRIRKDSASGKALLDWKGSILSTENTGDFREGTDIAWVIPPSHILLHRRDRPSRGERENPIAGRITEATALGEQTHILMQTHDPRGEVIEFTVSTHAARRNNLAAGEDIAVSLLASGIHIMPRTDE